MRRACNTQPQEPRVCGLGGSSRSATSAMSLCGELIATTRVQDLSGCRSLCSIPASVKRKKDLVEALQLQALCPHKHRALTQHLTANMTANRFRSWISSLRRAGFVVPDSRVMSGARVDVVDAIVRLDCLAGEYSSAQVCRSAAKLAEPRRFQERFVLVVGMLQRNSRVRLGWQQQCSCSNVRDGTQ